MCNVDGSQNEASQECLNKNLLTDLNNRTKIFIQKAYNGIFNVELKLPVGFVCDHCVFQVNLKIFKIFDNNYLIYFYNNISGNIQLVSYLNLK